MQQIPKGARQADAFRVRTLFYNSARDAFGDLLGNLPSGDGGVLLPAFIGWSPNEGSGMFDPVVGSGLPYGFYEPNADLTVDMEQLDRALATRRWRVVVLIHYWGRTEPRLAEVGEIARRHGAVLVEDLAHGFYSAARGAAGWAGAANLFSLHKMLPFADGGMITYRNLSLLSGQTGSRPDLAAQVLDYDWQAIGERRRDNFRRIGDRLALLPEHGTDFEMIWPDLAPLDAPQSLPIRVLNGRRDHVYSALNAQGYGMTSLYHTLIEPLRQDYPAMLDLAQTITNFPVHQDCPQEALDGMVEAFRQALGGAA